MGESNKRLAYLQLLIRACDALDIIFKALRSPDPKSGIMRGMKITEAEAEVILNLRVKQLSKLDQDQLSADVKNVQLRIKELSKLLKAPQLEVAKYLRSAAERFKISHNNCSSQWSM